jgi:hypothetical protein
MKVLTVYAHPDPSSFCHAVLQQFTKGLEDAGHTNEMVDLYVTGFDPVLRIRDLSYWLPDENAPDVVDRVVKERILASRGLPITSVSVLLTARSIVGNKRRISAEEARQVGTSLGINWKSIELEQFRRGLEVELEHGARDPETDVTHDDLNLTGKIAWAHLKEFPDYYTRLDKLEADADTYWTSRR